MFQVIVLAYAVVLLSEMIGDKTLYSVAALTARYQPVPILLGLIPACTLKALVAALFGGLLTSLPSHFIIALNATTFFILALVLSLKKPDSPPEPDAKPVFSMTASVAVFSTMFFSEWLDPGQLAAATLAGRYRAPAAVWIGASLALFTKSVLATLVGMQLRRRAPVRWVRAGAVCLSLVLGFLSLFTK
jgi:Ca2+/H+ antiporter, TMEM165/GDT1 family